MAIYRQVQMTFWTDPKVVDEFTPEDKFFYLYLFTNPHTNLAGCYEISVKSMSDETGYSQDTINRLIGRMADIHHVISYSKDTKEVLILKWSKYNWTRSKDFRKPLMNEINNVKCVAFKEYLLAIINEEDLSVYEDRLKTVQTPSQETLGTTVTVTVSDTVSDTVSVTDNNSIYINIIDYLNTKAGRRFNSSNKAVREVINGRVRDGYTEEDFYKVIDNKCAEWLGTEHEQYLRPSTLFAPSHFDEYLNQGIVKKKADMKTSSMSVNEYMLGVINGEIT